MRWVVVIPVKLGAEGKTRLADALSPGARERLVRAMAVDTVAAACAAPSVHRVVLVTADPVLRSLLATSTDLVDDPGGGLNAALRAGVERAREVAPDAGAAILLGDLPALRPEDLADALDMAAGHDRAVVADAEGSGTTLLAALPGITLDPQFGAGSSAAHERAGHVRLDVAATSTVRQDVDVPADLVSVEGLGVGPATHEVLGLG